MIFVKNAIEEFLSTNATNPTVAYDSGTTYSISDDARVDSFVYRSVLDNNLDNYPLENLNVSWMQWDSANDYAMLDLFSDTVTNWTADGIVVFERGSKEVLGIGNFNATTVTIEDLDAIDTVLETETYNYTAFSNMYNEWFYGYGGFEYDTTRAIYQDIKKIGTKIRVTFSNSGNATYCGFFVSGKAENMGTTLNKVNFDNKEYGKKLANLANFNTIMDKTSLMYILSKAKENYNEQAMFVIDPSETSSHNNMIILGKIIKYSGTGELASKNQITWQIEQNIRT